MESLLYEYRTCVLVYKYLFNGFFLRLRLKYKRTYEKRNISTTRTFNNSKLYKMFADKSARQMVFSSAGKYRHIRIRVHTDFNGRRADRRRTPYPEALTGILKKISIVISPKVFVDILTCSVSNRIRWFNTI